MSKNEVTASPRENLLRNSYVVRKRINAEPEKCEKNEFIENFNDPHLKFYNSFIENLFIANGEREGNKFPFTFFLFSTSFQSLLSED